MSIVAPTTIVDAPTAPDRADRATFSTRATASFAHLKDQAVPGFNAVAANVYNNAMEAATLATTASAQVALASAAANYKGPWSSLTGALNMPASVSHNGNYWALNANLANVTTSTPGVSSNWQALNVGAGGAAEVTSAVDVALTAASFRVQAVSITATDKSVTLPSATTLPVGAEIFVVKNTGTYAFCLRSAGGALLAKLSPGQCAAAHLANASTSAGVWALTGEGFAETIWQATALSVTSTVSSLLSVTALSATQSLATWLGTGGWISACVLTITGSSVSAGTILTTTVTSNNAVRYRVVTMSATQALLVYAASGTTYLSALTLNIVGTTVTNGAATQISATATSYTDVVVMSSTQAVVVYNGTSNYGEARTLNIAGTNVSPGAQTVAVALTIQGAAAAAISSTQLVACYSGSSEAANTLLLTVSGTNISITNGPISHLPGLVTAACGLSSTQVLLLGVTTYGPLCYTLIDTTGSVLSVKDIAEDYGAELQTTWHLAIKVSEGRVMVLRVPKGGSTLYGKSAVQIMRIADSRIIITGRVESLRNSKATGITAGSICMVTPTKVVAITIDSNDYVQARVLEVSI